MPTPRPTPLDRLADAVKRRALNPADLRRLRIEIARVRAGTDPHGEGLERPVKSLGVIDRQLRVLSERLGRARLEPQSFDALPGPVRRRVLARLETAFDLIREPMHSTPAAPASDTSPADAKPPPPTDPAFRCAAEHERCCQAASDGRFWCHIALAVCLVRTLLPLVGRP